MVQHHIFICILAITLGGIASTSVLDEGLVISNASSDTAVNTNTEEIPTQTGFSRQEDEDCVCVPYYQCDANRTIIQYGEGLFNKRSPSHSTSAISKRKRRSIKTKGHCIRYLDVCCKAPEALEPAEATSTTQAPLASTQRASSSCGHRNIGSNESVSITGEMENKAQFGEFPWMVAVTRRIEVGNLYECGGSIITPSVVLTTAACVSGKKELSVLAGAWDAQSTEGGTQIRQVREVLVHEGFHALALHNDVALLLLESPLELSSTVTTICLPEQNEGMDGRHCVASGWGKDVFGSRGRYQNITKKIEMPIVSRSPCLAALRKTHRLGSYFQLHESFICAGGLPGKDTCTGDGGSPLVCPSAKDPQVYVQAGIVSWGIGCGSDVPGVYVNVARFRNWIDNKLSTLN